MEIGDWEGGIYEGGVQHPDGESAVVRFSRNPAITEYFATRDYGSRDDALTAAMARWWELNMERNYILNRFRVIRDPLTNDEWLEVHLREGFTMLIDKLDYHLIEGRRVYSEKMKHGNIYAGTNIDGKNVLVHRLLNPDWPAVDHINLDGLDNRRRTAIPTLTSYPLDV